MLGDTKEDDVETMWGKLSAAITGAALETIGPRRHIRQPWMSEDTFGVLQVKSAARTHGHRVKRRRLQGVFNAIAKRDREAYLNKLADEVQDGLQHNNLRPTYRALRHLVGKSTALSPSLVHKLDGSPCGSAKEVLRRWQEHFETALNFLPADDCPILTAQSVDSRPNSTVNTDPATLNEIRRAIFKSKNSRASGWDNIAQEMLQCASEPIARGFLVLFQKIWQTGRVSADWRDGVVIPLYRDRSKSKNHVLQIQTYLTAVCARKNLRPRSPRSSTC